MLELRSTNDKENLLWVYEEGEGLETERSSELCFAVNGGGGGGGGK
jgi:hypothetical protein